MKKIDVKFSTIRWIILFIAIFIGWICGKVLFRTRTYRVLMGAIGGTSIYFYFYFKDKKK